MKYHRCITVLMACLFGAVAAFTLWAGERHSVTVTEVVDGDTLKVIYEGKEEKVRLDGIDAPECWPNPRQSAIPNRAEKT